jgi:cell division protein ZapE
MPLSVSQRYDALVETAVIERDPAQVAVVRRLDKLADEVKQRLLASKGSALGWMFSRRVKPEAPRGVYIWGGVGRGKTMLMDLFYESIPQGPKRRVHFHAFMADVHERIHRYRLGARAGVSAGDPIASVAADLAGEASLLCFDEFTVTDIADAMILGRLFTALLEAGVVIVATSNVEPSKLYEGGLNRALFEPFIDLLQERVDTVRLAARTDFRLEKLAGSPVWHVPADARADAALDAVFFTLSGVEQGRPQKIDVKGHELVIPQAGRGVARARFDDLCGKPYGAADFIAVAQRYHTLLLDAVPVMTIERRNEAKRFITLIDALYDHHVKLIASAQAEPFSLYSADSGREAFEFDRTASRLIEMRSDAYLQLPHGRTHSLASGATTGLVET